VWFTSPHNESEVRLPPDWECRSMSGTLIWWFGLNKREIVHCCDT
jgi:hypothetical protein